MLDLYAFYAVAAIVVASALLIFFQKRLLYSVICLTVVFAGSSILFIDLGQTLIAILSLLVFVGGFSVYLMVAIASEERTYITANIPYMLALSLVLFMMFSLLLNYLPQTYQQPLAPSFASAVSSSFRSDYPVLYLMVLLLFSIAISSTMVLRRFSRLIV